MTESTAPCVVGLGEALWDCFGPKRHPGGAPANVAYHVSQLGLQGAVYSRVGSDELGMKLYEHLEDKGLDVTNLQTDPHHATGTVTVDTREKDNPRYVIHQNVAWDYIQFDSAAEELAQRASAVCFGTLAQRSQASRVAIHRFLEATNPACILVYDVNLRQTWYNRTQLRHSLELAQIVKLNIEEVAVVGGLLDLPVNTPLAFARAALERFHLSLVCVTRGGDGCVLVGHDKHAEVPGRKIKVGDAVGAGDAFTAGMIAARLRNCSLEATAQFANEIGSLVASKTGGMPKLKKELAKLTETYLQAPVA